MKHSISQDLVHLTDVCDCVLPAKMALCAWNSWPATHSEQSVNRECSHNPPSSSASRQSGTFTMFIVFWPEIFTESWTTLTYTQKRAPINESTKNYWVAIKYTGSEELLLSLNNVNSINLYQTSQSPQPNFLLSYTLLVIYTKISQYTI